MNNRNIVIVCNETKVNLKKYQSYYKIGVERGALDIIAANLVPDLVCGDFDSVTEMESELIFQKAKKKLQLPKEKDYLDGEIAIMEALKIPSYQTIDFIAQGSRMEMNLACFGFLYNYSNLTYINDYSKAYLLKKGSNKIDFDNNYYYISFIAFEDSYVSIKKMKYNINHLFLAPFSARAISNEFITESGEVIVHKGKVVVIFTVK